MRIAANILQFQISWFACVLGAAWGRPAAGTLVALGLIALHIGLSQRVRRELAIVLFAAILGFTLDTALVQLDLLSFAAGNFVTGAAPFWMVTLWMGFATTLNVSLAWLRHRRALAALLGAVAGPAAYYAGAKLGAVAVGTPTSAYLGVAAIWALAMPALLLVTDRLDRASEQPSRGYA